MALEIIPVHIKKEIREGDNLTELILSSNDKIVDGDIIIITQKIISKQEGRTINLSAVIPSILSVGLGVEYKKDPKLVEVILAESIRIVRMERSVIIVETKHGFVCANAGVDESNIEEGFVTLLPKDPDDSAKKIQQRILEKTGKKVAVLITDTFGRPFRLGQTNCAIGISGIDSLLDYKGKKDSFGRILRVTSMAVADEICSAAELVMGKSLQCPVAILRNYIYTPSEDKIANLIRPKEEDLFR